MIYLISFILNSFKYGLWSLSLSGFSNPYLIQNSIPTIGMQKFKNYKIIAITKDDQCFLKQKHKYSIVMACDTRREIGSRRRNDEFYIKW